MPDQTPAQTLTAAAQALRDPDVDACQEPGCGCPEELHYRDANGRPWCTDCEEKHPYRPAPASDIPERLRGPLADWLELTADVINSRVLANPTDEHTVDISDEHALLVARAVLGEVTQ